MGVSNYRSGPRCWKHAFGEETSASGRLEPKVVRSS